VRFLRFPRNIQIEKNVVIKEGVRICPCNIDAKIKIGKNTTIGYHTFIFGSHSIEIGDDCLIAPFVYIVDSNHQIKKGMKINEQPNESAPILIGNDVWISSNVTILKGVKIGDGAVIGANSLVNQDIPEYAIFAGTPAKMIGKRQ
jgi:acetyltransferase-like isoleucine patch superfamily enzyme